MTNPSFPSRVIWKSHVRGAPQYANSCSCEIFETLMACCGWGKAVARNTGSATVGVALGKGVAVAEGIGVAVAVGIGVCVVVGVELGEGVDEGCAVAVETAVPSVGLTWLVRSGTQAPIKPIQINRKIVFSNRFHRMIVSLSFNLL